MSDRIRFTRQTVVANSFYKLPQFLFSGEFAQLSSHAKLLYALMQNRHAVSIKNNWFDENGEAYFYFKRELMCSKLGLSDKTVDKVIKELKALNLMEERRQGHNRPNKIYLLAPIFSPDFNINDDEHNPEEKCENDGENDFECPPPATNAVNSRTRNNSDTGHGDITPPDTESLHPRTRNISDSGHGVFPTPDTEKLPPSKNKFNKTKLSNNPESNIHALNITSRQVCQSSENRHDGQDETDIPRKLENYLEIVKENIGYDDFANCRGVDIRLVDDFVHIIIDTIFTRAPTIRISGEDKPTEIVRSFFLKLTHRDIEHAMNQFKSVIEPITHKQRYIRTLLYNCKLEGDAHYTNAYMSGT